MKSIKEMAHDYMCNAILKGFPLDEIDTIAERCFKLAEAMQAEAEKRKDKSSNDFEVDWSQAPSWAKWHLSRRCGRSVWFEDEPTIGANNTVCTGNSEEAPFFNFNGDGAFLLRKRP